MKIMIIGEGRFTYFLARAFISKGYWVTLISRDESECRWLARRLKAVVVHGDGSDPRTLASAEIARMDAVLALTPKDEDNLVICQIARFLYGVRRTLTLVDDPENETVFRKLGIENVFSMTAILSGLVERRVESADIINLLPIGEGQANLTEIVLTAAAPVLMKPLKDVALPQNCLVACIFRDGQAIIPRGDTVLFEGDRLVIINMPDAYAAMIRTMTGETDG